MSPYELSILLHIHTRADELPVVKTPLLSSTLSQFMEDDLITDATETAANSEHGYELTLLGCAWVKSILSTPKPRQVFVDQFGNIID